MSEQNGQDGLPPGWAWTTLGDVCSKPQYGWTTKANNETGSVRLLRTTDISKGSVAWDAVPYCTEVPEALEAYLLCAGDLVISRAGSVGLSYLVNHVPEPTVFASYLIRFRAGDGVEPQYLAYYLQTPTYWNAVYEQSAGIALANINARKLEAMSVPLAPLAEQQRIVAAIEQQFTRLDAGVAALRRVRAALKRYRAAVLKAAVEGRLTEAWRAAHPDAEPAAALLARILAERRSRWEAELRAKGKDPAKARYPEPAAPDTASLPALPEGWCWATVEQLAAPEPNAITDGPFGSNLKTEHYRSEGMRVIRLQNIGDGIFRDELAYISPEHFEVLGKHRIFAGDVVIAALGDSPPRSCIIPEFVGPAIVKADCIRFMVSPHMLGAYANACLNADPTRQRTAALLHGIGRPRLNLGEVKSIVVALPSVAEQVEIVAEMERRLSVVSEAEAAIAANLTRAERLRQSILERAFAGRLVPQDPNDEPASALLERIREARAGRAANGSAGRNGRNDSGGHERAGAAEETEPVTARQQPLWR